MAHQTTKRPIARTQQSSRPAASVAAALTDEQRRRLGLHTRYFRVVVRNPDDTVALVIRCKPEERARNYAASTNSQTARTGRRAELQEIELSPLPASLMAACVE